MEKFCPKKVEIDLAGKRQEYEGVPILPFIDYDYIEKLYYENERSIDSKELKRNILIKTSLFTNGKKNKTYLSIYGNIETKIKRNYVNF
jgi:5'-3' exonuclease